MSKQSNWSKKGSYSINDKIGSEHMPVEGAEAPRSFADGTGKRKYDKNDSSVVEMRKQRARAYSNPSFGMPWGFTSKPKKIKTMTIKTKNNTEKSKLSKSKAHQKAKQPTVSSFPDLFNKKFGG